MELGKKWGISKILFLETRPGTSEPRLRHLKLGATARWADCSGATCTSPPVVAGSSADGSDPPSGSCTDRDAFVDRERGTPDPVVARSSPVRLAISSYGKET